MNLIDMDRLRKELMAKGDIPIHEVFNTILDQPIVNICEVEEQQPCEDMGEVSDGYHTFNQLYHQRAVLFATIVNQNKDKSWKSFKHSDGNYCFDRNGEWFIVGIDTPQGSYTYHYTKEYWDMFDCQELECGKEWDGHTEEDVTRLLSLQKQLCEDYISRKALIERINNAEENFKADNMESIESGDGDPFVDGVLSGVFNIRIMVQQAPSVIPKEV